MWNEPELYPERYRAAFGSVKLAGLCIVVGMALMLLGTGTPWAVGFLLVVLGAVGWLASMVDP